jgi:hypothetical protein
MLLLYLSGDCRYLTTIPYTLRRFAFSVLYKFLVLPSCTASLLRAVVCIHIFHIDSSTVRVQGDGIYRPVTNFCNITARLSAFRSYLSNDFYLIKDSATSHITYLPLNISIRVLGLYNLVPGLADVNPIL